MRKHFLFKDKYNNLIAKGETITYKIGGVKAESKAVVSHLKKTLDGPIVVLYDGNRHVKQVKLFPHECIIFGVCDRLYPSDLSYAELINWLNGLDFTKYNNEEDDI